MKSAVIIFSLLIALAGNAFSKTYHTQQKTNRSFNVDTSRYAILKFDKRFENICGFGKGVQSATLSDAELAQIEKLIAKQIAYYNSKLSSIKNPSKYYKQLIAVTNGDGEKEVWVNCLCSVDDKSRFKRDIIGVLDGGSCYFQLKVNLTKNTVYDLMVNGVG